MCCDFDCNPMNLIGKVVRGVGSGKYHYFKGVRNTQDDYYLIEGVTYKHYGKTYNFTLKELGWNGSECVIPNCRRGTFYNQFEYTREIPESIYDHIQWKMKHLTSQIVDIKNNLAKKRKLLKSLKRKKENV